MIKLFVPLGCAAMIGGCVLLWFSPDVWHSLCCVALYLAGLQMSRIGERAGYRLRWPNFRRGR